jgi:phosphatidylserine/phosphatidylglycerophosphate/cardiolipin synthase-like enzyme
METGTPQEPGLEMRIYFSPQDKKDIKEQLFSLLNNAQNIICIAMYWLIDDEIINKLISLKQSKPSLAIQIIFDSSAPNTTPLTKKLLYNNIIPLIYPETSDSHMHNKFTIVDNQAVITGSANFTKNALEKNFETTMVLKNSAIAEKFFMEFNNIGQTIVNLYISMIAKYEQKNLPNWVSIIAPVHFKHQALLYHTLVTMTKENKFNQTELERLKKFFEG